MPLPDHIREAIQRVFSSYPDVEAVFVFGSYAEGRATEGSDLDLGVVARQEAIRKKLDMLAELVHEGLESVDLVFLNQADPVVRFEAVRPNVLAYRREDFDRGSYYSRTIREYFDLKPLLQRQREGYKRRIQNRK